MGPFGCDKNVPDPAAYIGEKRAAGWTYGDIAHGLGWDNQQKIVDMTRAKRKREMQG